ncbi:hypothetical protein LguiB_028567 [Lonicera macranthoides]
MEVSERLWNEGLGGRGTYVGKVSDSVGFLSFSYFSLLSQKLEQELYQLWFIYLVFTSSSLICCNERDDITDKVNNVLDLYEILKEMLNRLTLPPLPRQILLHIAMQSDWFNPSFRRRVHGGNKVSIVDGRQASLQEDSLSSQLHVIFKSKITENTLLMMITSYEKILSKLYLSKGETAVSDFGREGASPPPSPKPAPPQRPGLVASV